MSEILILMDQKENRRHLAECLKARYKVIFAENDEALEGSFDMCVLDGVAMERLSDKVRQRKEAEEPLFLPILLLTTKDEATFTTRSLWQFIDELVHMPVDRSDLLARVEVLLRARKQSEESAWTYYALSRNIPAAVFIVQDEKVVYANPLASAIKSGEKDPAGSSFFELFLPEFRETILHSYRTVIQGINGTAACMAAYKTGAETRLADICMVPISHRRKEAVLAIANDVTERINTEKSLLHSQEELRRLISHQDNVREEERARIAREIHDEFGQALTYMRIDLLWMNKRIPGSMPVICEKLKELIVTVDQTIESVTKIATDLRPRILDDLGLVTAMEWQAREFRKHHAIEVETFFLPAEMKVSPASTTVFFRIFQEALTNIARHSKATLVNVRLQKKRDSLILEVIDNGIGCTQEKLEHPSSLGLIGIRERVLSLGGTLEITSEERKGTTIFASIPTDGRGKLDDRRTDS
ncbi:MAG: histidine kinase [Candidatus Eremiobacteraeota bacterium]|nr:histidine kinase [Candidatus Eremiobacteraeota bacterium]